MMSTRVADRYVLDREIGRGGSGAVWLGRDEVLRRMVALKRVGIPAGAENPDLARAEREARLAARVSHPNVIAVFDFVEDDGGQWLVMEYVEGTTLARMIRDRGPISADDASPVLAQTADALAAAHRLSIVHRDVKPSNILVGVDGKVRLSDFGIARAIADVSLTQTGLVTGSPAYLSPEVATGSSATTASDVWSFGATMYHALAGRPPYHVEGNVLGALYKIAHEEPPRLRTAGWLGPLLEMTMTRDPAQRPHMTDVAEYLHARVGAGDPEPTQEMPATAVQFSPAPPASTPPAPASTPSPTTERSGPLRIALIGAAVVAVLAVIGGLLLWGGPDDRSPVAADPSRSATDGGSGAQGSDGDPATEPPTEAELEEFATSYVTTASSDPDAGFAMLTPEYQQQSPEYEDFWGPMSNPRMLAVKADPEAMTVTYTYKYDYPSVGNRTERVTLHLVQDGDRLLIANAS